MKNNLPTIQQLMKDSTLPNYPNITLSNYPLMIKEVKALIAKNNKPYLVFTFSDKTSLINAVLWNTKESEITKYPAGRVALINGFTANYEGRLDIQIKSLSLLDPSHQYADPSLYVKAAPFQRNQIEPVINEFLEALKGHNLLMYKLISTVFEPRKDKFYQQASSQKGPYAVAGGVAQHTVFMLQLANNIKPLYPNVNYDVLKASILLHDLGKVDSLTNPLTSEQTKQGLLLSPSTIVDGYLLEAATVLGVDLKEETLLLIRHTILSSKINPEIAPLTREALVIHHLNALDSDMFSMDETLNGVNLGDFSQPSFTFNNRKMYRSNI